MTVPPAVDTVGPAEPAPAPSRRGVSEVYFRRDRFRRDGAVAALAAAVLIAAYTGFRTPNDWSVTLYSVSLQDGFHRRFLLGSLAWPLARVTGYNYWAFAFTAFTVLLLLLAAICLIFVRSRLLSQQFLIVAWFVLPAGGYLFHEVGYLDQVLYLMLFVALWFGRRGRWWAAAALMVAASLVHEIALLTVLPVFFTVAFAERGWRRGVAVTAPSAAAGLVVLAIPAATPENVQRHAARLATANFPFRADALELFTRTQSASWHLYSVQHTLLFLLPYAALAAAATLVVQGPWGGVRESVDGPRATASRSMPPLLVLGAAVAPTLLAFAGWDSERWAFLIMANTFIVLWLRLESTGAELSVSVVGVLALILLLLAHLPLEYFDGFTPRELSLSGAKKFVGQLEDRSVLSVPPQ